MPSGRPPNESKCELDSSPLIEDINDMLRAGKSHGDVRAYIIESGGVPPERYTLSRHSLRCLALAPRSRGNPKPPAKPDESIPLPSLKEISKEALRLFYHRLTQDPGQVNTRDLLPFITEALKQMTLDDKKSDLDEMLAQLASANQEG